MDAGDILAQCRTEIDGEESAGELHDRLAKLASPLLVTTIDQIAAGHSQIRQTGRLEGHPCTKAAKDRWFSRFH